MKNFIFLILFIIFIITLYIFLKINMIYLLRTFSNPYDKIIDFLYVGSIKSLPSYNNFSLIVNSTPDINPLNKINKYNDIYIRLPINDNPDDYSKLLPLIYKTNVLEKIHHSIINKKSVLVHCYSGMQRSCAVVACYLIKYHNMNVNEAIEFIQNKRYLAFYKNVHFIESIKKFYLENKK